VDVVNTPAFETSFNPTGAQVGPLPRTTPCLHELIEEQAARTPRLPSVVFEDDRLSYAELARRAQLLAGHLRARGIAPDVRVALFMDRCVDLVVGIIAVLEAGGAYVPIDSAYPRARIDYILRDAGPRLLLTQSHLLAALSSNIPETVCVDRFNWGQHRGEAFAGSVSRAEDLAYVIYTSGSTGLPKGVCVEHRNIVNYAAGVAARLNLEPGLSYALVSTVAADLGNTQIFPALITGGCLHVISQARAEDPDLLSSYFTRERIDVLKIAPSHLAALQSGRNPEQVMPHRKLILGGEATPLDRVGWLRALSPWCEIHNHYGPTETTVGVLMYRLGPQVTDTPSGTLPLGTPLPNSRVHVLARDGQPVPEGEQGEIYIGGAGVARGYLNRPELTAERFVPDPFSTEPHARLYRSGDLGRRLPDGNIEYCGRIDNEVKVNGFRVSLEEIDYGLGQLAGVRQAVTVAYPRDAGGKHLVAHIVPERAAQPLWGFSNVHILPDGAPVAHLNRNETEYIYNEIFVLQAYLRHGIAIHEDDCIIDAGANIGLFTVFASRLAQRLKIVACEPNPAAFACLRANAEAWGGAVTCLPFALSDRERVGELIFFEGFSLLSGFYADAQTERAVIETYVQNQQPFSVGSDMAVQIGQLIEQRMQARTVKARMRTLSSIIAELGLERVDLLKVNVEKSELDVLRGLEDRDWGKIRQIVVEVDREANLGPIIGLLKAHGLEYRIEQDPLLRRTELCYVYALRPGRAAQPPHPGSPLALRPPPGDILTPAILRGQAGERLPRYMVPNTFVLTDELPLLPNGKVDRQRLSTAPAPTAAVTQPKGEPQHPATETEKALAAIWRELLGVEAIGRDDDFFQLGGHSLLAITMASRVREAFQIDVQLQAIFDYPTLAELAHLIHGLLASEHK